METILILTGVIHTTPGSADMDIPIQVLVLVSDTLTTVSASIGAGPTDFLIILLIMTPGMVIILIIHITEVIIHRITPGMEMMIHIPVMAGEKDRVQCLPELMKMHLQAEVVTHGEMLQCHQELPVQPVIQGAIRVIIQYPHQQAEELILQVVQVLQNLLHQGVPLHRELKELQPDLVLLHSRSQSVHVRNTKIPTGLIRQAIVTQG
jgi:hypothetical protein